MSIRTALEEMNAKGAFIRTESSFRRWIGSDLPAAKGRYHLYISYACPWANRTLAVLKLKGLESAIGVSIVHPTWQRTKPESKEDTHAGWVFRKPTDDPVVPLTGYGAISCEDCIPDEINGAKSIRELYELSEGSSYSGKYTVPVLWDAECSKIVNNESADIVLMLNCAFNEIAENPSLDLYPESLKKEIDAVNEWIYSGINNGVYRCGFAKSQEAYEDAVKALFDSLDRVEEILGTQRFIVGNQLTIADVRLFMTLIRFDEVYVVYFKCDKKCIRDYPNIFGYCQDLFSNDFIRSSINMRHIKAHYYTSHPLLNSYSIIPTGPRFIDSLLNQPHNRDKKFGSESRL
jgi:putative glutathione S-transferase